MIYPLQLKGGHMYLGLPISCKGSEFGVGSVIVRAPLPRLRGMVTLSE